MNTPDRELLEWQQTWQTNGHPSVSLQTIRAAVRERGRTIAIWIAGEVVVGLAAIAFVLYRVATQPDFYERLAMSLLAVIAGGALAFEWWNWRDVMRTSATTTTRYLSLAIERSRRLRRSVQAAWIILTAEVVVFVPWIWNRLYGNGIPPLWAERFGWGWLAGFTLIAVIGIVALQRWVERDARALESLARETETD